jgi:hypothetical protein
MAGGRPVYFAQAYIYIQNLKNMPEQAQGMYLGQLTFKAGWYLDTTVEIDGVKRKIGVIDSDSNFRLGDIGQAQTYQAGDNEERWYFNDGDSFLFDHNGSGVFESDRFASETVPFGSILYFGQNPYKVALARDCASLKVEPWTEPLAEVVLQPQGDQVSSVTLAREARAGKWELIEVGVAKGKAKVPPGNYRLYSCRLQVKTADGQPLAAEGTQQKTKTPLSFRAGKTNVLLCGAPLNIDVKTDKRKPQPYEMVRDQAQNVADSEYILSINATVVGQGGELYSTYGKGKGFTNSPSKPAFAVLDSKSTRGSGNLEFG